jgi:hypothetical protein
MNCATNHCAQLAALRVTVISTMKVSVIASTVAADGMETKMKKRRKFVGVDDGKLRTNTDYGDVPPMPMKAKRKGIDRAERIVQVDAFPGIELAINMAEDMTGDSYEAARAELESARNLLLAAEAVQRGDNQSQNRLDAAITGCKEPKP